MALFESRGRPASGSHLTLLFLSFFIGMHLMAQEPGDLNSDSDLTHLQLTVGQSSYLAGTQSDDLLASRKGIIDLYFTRDKKWRITGLRPGFLSIRSANKQWMITVIKAENNKASNRQKIPEWICKLPGVSCHHQAKILSGNFHDRYTYLQAQDWCRSHLACLFTASLSLKEQRLLISDLMKHVPQKTSISMTANQLPVIEMECSSGSDAPLKDSTFKESSLLSSLIQRKLIQIKCRQQKPQMIWAIKSKIFLTSHQQIVERGFQFSTQPGIELTKTLNLTGKILSKLNDLATKNQAKIIAEPLILVQEGVKSKVTSGGEFSSQIPWSSADKRSRIYWKEYGISLEAQVLRSDKNYVALEYQMTLKQPSQGNQGHLNSQFLKSQMTLPHNTPVLAGQVKLNHHRDGKEHSPALSDIPLIGPLFRKSADQKDDSTLFVWFEVSEHNSSASDQEGENFSDNFSKTRGGTNPETFPPNAATSLTMLDEM